jgi:hypothetical protein
MNQGPLLGDVVFHKEQALALKRILNGENLILSAPTSFGKSLVIDAALASGVFRRAAIILPTIALLDETRRRLERRFSNNYDLIIHPSEASRRERVIFLGTQERLINREDVGSLDLLIVDEFYKLDSRRRDQRSPILNAAVYHLLHRAKQFFFLGPNIEAVFTREGTPWKFEFLRARYSTVAVDMYDLRKSPDKEASLAREAYAVDNWPVLIFASSPDRANSLAKTLKRDQVTEKGEALADWLRHNFGTQWELPDFLRSGIGTHHGRVPRTVSSHLVRLFNRGDIPILICTSTLIEGVNTAAKSVLIYDKKIENRPYDFFTFSNIRGRAGRLGEHHVGKVYIFGEPPRHSATDVTSPIFVGFSDAALDFAVHLDEADLRGPARERVEEAQETLGLSQRELQRYSGIGIGRLGKLKEAVAEALEDGEDLVWSNWPRWNNLLACCRVICSVKSHRKFGAWSPKQLALYLARLSRAGTMRDFFEKHSAGYRGSSASYDEIFKFLRSCEYSLPEYFGAIELFLLKMGRNPDYSVALGGLPRWFRSESLKIVEERGIPIQISERFCRLTDDHRTLSRRLLTLAQSDDPRLTPIEREWILLAQ